MCISVKNLSKHVKPKIQIKNALEVSHRNQSIFVFYEHLNNVFNNGGRQTLLLTGLYVILANIKSL